MTHDGWLGRCPNCGNDVRQRDGLISFRRSDGSVGVFAECPSCEAVVDPRTA